MSSTTSDEAASADPRYLEGNRVMRLMLSTMLNVSSVFHQYFENEATTPSLARFYEFDSDIIIHSSPRSRIKEIWNKRFLTAAEKFNVKVMVMFFECMHFGYAYMSSPTCLDCLQGSTQLGEHLRGNTSSEGGTCISKIV